jgi:hypothetical protein
MVSLLLLSFALVAQPPADLSEADLVHGGGDDFLLRAHVENALYADPAIGRELMRVGLEHGCLVADAAQARAVEANRAAFNGHLAAAMRTVVPAEAWTPHANIFMARMEFYRDRIDREIARTGAPVYEDAVRQARSALAADLAAAPSVAPAEAAGRLADWRLETPLALKIACHIISSTQGAPDNFRRLKLVFDGFYRRQGE